MENKNTINDLYSRQYATETTQRPINEPVTPSEQIMHDRRAFEQFADSHRTTTAEAFHPERPGSFSEDDARAYIESTLNTFKEQRQEQYKWLAAIDSSVIARVMNEVNEFRSAYLSANDRLPTDARIYREYRLKLELGDNDPQLKETVVILGALMKDDVINGTFPDTAKTPSTSVRH